MAEAEQVKNVAGPHLWRNSQAWKRGDRSRERVEDAIYSDADVEGTVEVGPHHVISSGARPASGLTLRVVLRAELHDVDLSAPDYRTTSAEAFHGGDLADEVAALLALALGTRFRSGGMTRTWGLDFALDPLGEPIEFFHTRPYLPAPGARGTVLPRAHAHVKLGDAAPLLERVIAAPASQATALVRAARQYQAALWVADDDPSQAWLHLVGAVETAAGAVSLGRLTHIEKLRLVRPDLAAVLDRADEDVRKEVAKLLSGTLGVQAKFVRFLTRFGPSPPTPRPPDWASIAWDELEAVFRAVYGYRSMALHAATPFPVPMCEPPETFQDHGGALSERPEGIATHAYGSTWRTEDAPMLLATFEYITRHALLRWALH